MMIPFAPAAGEHRIGLYGSLKVAVSSLTKDMFMKWETPQAVDFRFGMEITMYIANR